jgi:hypothetical protein
MAFLTQRARWPSGSAARHSLPWLPMLLAIIALLGTSTLHAADRHYQLKAAFLVNFAQYVEWPSEAFPTNDAPVVFGILGQNPFDGSLKELIAGEVVNGRRAIVREFRSVREIGRCHVLFIADSERSRLPAILRGLRGRSILTVSDIDRFNDEGGIIRFVTEERVRFRINAAAARDASLTISSKLLRLAEDVDTAQGK